MPLKAGKLSDCGSPKECKKAKKAKKKALRKLKKEKKDKKSKAKGKHENFSDKANFDVEEDEISRPIPDGFSSFMF